MGRRSTKLYSQAEEAVMRSGPEVAERVGIAFFDVVEERALLSVSVVGGIFDGDMSDSDS